MLSTEGQYADQFIEGERICLRANDAITLRLNNSISSTRATSIFGATSSRSTRVLRGSTTPIALSVSMAGVTRTSNSCNSNTRVTYYSPSPFLTTWAVATNLWRCDHAQVLHSSCSRLYHVLRGHHCICGRNRSIVKGGGQISAL